MIRLLPIIMLLAGCACKVTLPDDTVAICSEGKLWIYSREAKEKIDSGIACRMESRESKRDETI